MAAPLRNGNLPTELTSFIGRRREVAEVRKVLPSVRMLTLTGTGGVGKSRLALRVANQTRRAFPDGVWLVELASLQDRELLAQTVADAVGLRDRSSLSPREALVKYLRDKQLLLVLDNCEHLSTSCAALAGELLATAPRLRMLATSRQALGTPGEQIFPLPPMPSPVADRRSTDSAADDTIQLFRERAAAVVPGFTVTEVNRATIAQICHQLDGLPLAIELAAARVRILSPEQILRRLDNRFQLLTENSPTVPPRHQTLRAVLDWSYELCSPVEQRLWARMSVFAGGCDLDAAEAVCAGDGIAPQDVLDAVSGLVDKSILTRDQPDGGAPIQYRLLDTIRHYGGDKLLGADEYLELRRRHRDHYLRMVERHSAEWFGPDQAQIAARTRGEHANLRLALEHCANTPGESEVGLRMTAALHFYWFGCGALTEGRHWSERLLALDVAPSRARAATLWTTCHLAVAQGDHADAADLAEESFRWAEAAGDRPMQAHAWFALGTVEWAAGGDLVRARDLILGSIALFEELGLITAITALAYVTLCAILTQLQDLDGAITASQQADALCTQHGDRWAHAYMLYIKSLAEWMRGDLARARASAEGALRDQQVVKDALGTVFVIECLAWFAGSAGECERAAVLLGAANRLYPMGGSKPLADVQGFHPLHDECVRQARRGLGDDGFEVAFARGSRFDSAEAVTYALGESIGEAPPRADAPDDPLAPLTQRERQVAVLVAEGLSNKDVAARLVISTRTAEGHIQHVLSKLGLVNRIQLAVWLQEHRPVNH